MEGLLAAALLLGLVGAVLVWWAVSSSRRRGLGGGETVALDDLVLYSERFKLVGRPDRIERRGEVLIPEEWKPSAKQVYAGHRLQLGAYFVLIEEEFGVRPPFGVAVIRDGERIEVENTERLRSEVLAMAERIRASRANIEAEISVNQPAWKCRVCGQRGNCRQARG